MLLKDDDEGYTVVYGLVAPYLTRRLSSSPSSLFISSLNSILLSLLSPLLYFYYTCNTTHPFPLRIPSTPPLDFHSGKLIFIPV